MDFVWFLDQANNEIVILLKYSHLYVQVEEFYVYIVLNEWENYTNYLAFLTFIDYILASAPSYIFNFVLVSRRAEIRFLARTMYSKCYKMIHIHSN